MHLGFCLQVSFEEKLATVVFLLLCLRELAVFGKKNGKYSKSKDYVNKEKNGGFGREKPKSILVLHDAA